MPRPTDTDSPQRPAGHVPVFVHPSLANDLITYYGPKGHVSDQPPEVDPERATRGSGAFTFLHGGRMNAVTAGDPVPPGAQQVQFHPHVPPFDQPKQPAGREPSGGGAGGGADFPGGAAGTDYSRAPAAQPDVTGSGTGGGIELPVETPSVEAGQPDDEGIPAFGNDEPSDDNTTGPIVEIDDPNAPTETGTAGDPHPIPTPPPDSLPEEQDEDGESSNDG